MTYDVSKYTALDDKVGIFKFSQIVKKILKNVTWGYAQGSFTRRL